MEWAAVRPDAFTRILRVLSTSFPRARGSGYCFTFRYRYRDPSNVILSTFDSFKYCVSVLRRGAAGQETKGVRQFGPIIRLYQSTWPRLIIDLK